jgi:hypothetical protein
MACFSRSTECEGIDTDSLGNVYLLLYHREDLCTFAVVMLEAATNTVVQLVTLRKDAEGTALSLAVTPDGQHLYVGITTSDISGKVLHYQAPFKDAKPQLVAQLPMGDTVCLMFADNNT